MSRENKFRWFDKEAHEWGESGMIYCDKLPSEYMLTVDEKGCLVLLVEGQDCDVRGLDWVEVEGTEMQYTGLKDKNGVEIYEGDLIGYFVHIYKVGFHKGSFGLFSLKHNGFTPFFESVELSCDVIGNIHENPELLK